MALLLLLFKTQDILNIFYIILITNNDLFLNKGFIYINRWWDSLSKSCLILTNNKYICNKKFIFVWF